MQDVFIGQMLKLSESLSFTTLLIAHITFNNLLIELYTINLYKHIKTAQINERFYFE